MLGLYPPGEELRFQFDDLAPGLSQLPFKIRDRGLEMPSTFTAVPVMSVESGN